MTRLLKTVLLATTVAAGLAAPAFAQDSVLLPNLSYRTGPFAVTGIPLMNGQADYMAMINERDGGANGVKLNYQECETGYNTEKGVECYEKTKAEGAIVTQPWSTGITLQVLPKSNVDKMPVLAPGYGFSAMQDGKVFQWAFNPPASYWDGASMILQNIAGGNLDSLKGKKIALLHLDHPYGKEPIPLLESYAAKYGFTLLPIPVGLKEMQNQSAQWLQIRREKPDFVVMWGWGAMNAGAVTEAVKTNYPMNQFVGIWWSGLDGDLKLVGEKGKGYRYPVLEHDQSRCAGHEGHQEAGCRYRQVPDQQGGRRVRLGVLPARRSDFGLPGRSREGRAGELQNQGGRQGATALGSGEPEVR